MSPEPQPPFFLVCRADPVGAANHEKGRCSFLVTPGGAALARGFYHVASLQDFGLARSARKSGNQRTGLAA